VPGEIRKGLRLVGVVERWGSESQDEGDEWRRRILAKQQLLNLDQHVPNS
jgi:hypothetical protein